MSTERPLVSVYSSEKKDVVAKKLAIPDVFQAPVRVDIVQTIFSAQKKNKRQSYAVSRYAGMQTAAESWGTGRAVSRIPRVPGGGTHRAGQGAFGNMCRGGRLFAPTKVWRKWHQKISTPQRRFANASALSASASPSLVKSRGHVIDNVNELPLVVSDDIESYTKAKAAMQFLVRVGASQDVLKAKHSKRLRVGRGKSRNRRFVRKLGPLVIYKNDNGIVRAFRNIPGVETCQVNSMNLLQLAPGAQVGRFIIWSESAFNELNKIYGSYKGVQSSLKTRSGLTYKLPTSCISNSDIGKIINSKAVQSVIRDQRLRKKRPVRKVNPLKCARVMAKLNPLTEKK